MIIAVLIVLLAVMAKATVDLVAAFTHQAQAIDEIVEGPAA